jgi:hypothetical protein
MLRNLGRGEVVKVQDLRREKYSPKNMGQEAKRKSETTLTRFELVLPKETAF